MTPPPQTPPTPTPATPPTPAGPTRCLSVVIPCFNELATVATVVERVLASPWTSEIVLVDDGSTDGTRDVLATLAAPDDAVPVRVLLHERNQGKGAALRTGFAAAAGPFVVVQDADLEYDPAEFGVLLAPLVDGRADVVYGSRFLGGRPHRVLYFWHSVGNRLLTVLSNMFTDLNLTDMETCYKAFRKEVGRWRVYEVGISYAGRTYDEGKKIGWKDGVRAVWCIVRYSAVGRLLGADRAS